MKTIFWVIAGIVCILLSGCKSVNNGSEKTIFINSETRPCKQGELQTDCLQIKWTKEQTDWEILGQVNVIEGFLFESGYEYELIISEEKVENPPQDASSIRYKLVKQVSKTKVGI